jgi:hypothetical protein
MVGPYSFQDTLARLHAETRAVQERAEGQAKYGRFLDFQLGKAIGSKLVASIASDARSADEAVRNLRHAAQRMSGTLSGQVAAGELREAAQHYEVEVERQQPQREADASLIALRERLARAHAERQGEVDRDWYERQRERSR